MIESTMFHSNLEFAIGEKPAAKLYLKTERFS